MYKEQLLILAIVLIVVGAILYYAGAEFGLPSAGVTIGGIILLLGIIALAIWIVLLIIDRAKTA